MPQAAFDTDDITDLSPFSDDLWLKWMEAINGVPTVLCGDFQELATIPNTQAIGLYETVNGPGGNDEQIARLVDKYGSEMFKN